MVTMGYYKRLNKWWVVMCQLPRRAVMMVKKEKGGIERENGPHYRVFRNDDFHP